MGPVTLFSRKDKGLAMDDRNRTPVKLATVFATLIVGLALLVPACGEHITEFTPAGDAGTSCGGVVSVSAANGISPGLPR